MDSRKKKSKFYILLYKLTKLILVTAFGYKSILIISLVPTYKSMFIYSGGMILMIVLGMLLKIQFNRHGFQEVIYSIVLCPSILTVSQTILLGQFELEPAVRFSSFNFLFIIMGITEFALPEESKSSSITQTQREFISVYKLLGKTDSFRIIIIILGYCVFYSIS